MSGVCFFVGVYGIFFFKQKTAYELRISDWSSDVCSSDLAAARGRLELLTPLAKAHATDVGCLVTSLGVQVHGGMGYIEETGAAQYFRDARLTPIYEGTNGIQAADLVGRKLPMAGGAVCAELIADMRGEGGAATAGAQVGRAC